VTSKIPRSSNLIDLTAATPRRKARISIYETVSQIQDSAIIAVTPSGDEMIRANPTA
jgi:hypothetical protein